MAAPRLTLITVTFNAEAVLERTLRSVRNQTVRDFEYLVIDGASTDGTLTLVRAAGDVVTRWLSEPDRGIYDAMNKGLAAATGEYVWFLNAGDELHDAQVIEQFYDHLAADADVYYGDALFVREDGSAIGLRSDVTPHRLPTVLTWRDFDRGMVVCHQSFIARRRLAPPYRLDHFYSADVDWEIRCLKAARRVAYLPFVLSRYLVGGFSVKNLRRSLEDRFVILKTHFGLVPTLWNHARILWRGFWFARRRGGKYW
jgi:glycosyltransferase involved in cell wall biosynthesis